MKVAVFSAKCYDRELLAAANAEAGHELVFFDDLLETSTVALTAGCGAVCVFVNDRVDAPVLAALAAGGTRLVALRCTGFNNVDLKAAAAHSIKVVRVTEYSPYSVAEHAVALILALSRKIVWIAWAVVFGVAIGSTTTIAQPKWADPAKTLHVTMDGGEAGFDPQVAGDTYSFTVISAIFDALYQYDYLGGSKIVPKIAAGLPEISADGRIWTIRIKPGVYFADDPAFKGKKRELTAADFVYSWKRLLDPRVRSPNVDILAERIAGARAAMELARSRDRFDYDAEIEGLRAIDRHTLQIKLVEPDYTLLPYLTGSALAAVAREVIAAHASADGRAMEHPVGTGPYRLVEWRRGQKMVLEANSNYREEYFPDAPAGADAATKAFAATMRGKRLPQVGRIELSVIEEPQPALLGFESGTLDYFDLPFEIAPKALDASGRLLPAFAGRGVTVQRITDMGLGYLYFNMDDPVVGGIAPERIALRRAVMMAYDVEQEIKVVRNGQAQVATQPVPPDADGHVQGLDVRVPYDPGAARALLDKFGYRDRDGDGLRESPAGQPLTLHIGTTPEDREREDLIRKNLLAVGLRVEFVNRRWAELLKMAQAGQVQVWLLGLFTTTADGIFLNLYGPAAGSANIARFRNAEFDELYRRSKRTASDEERVRIYEKMSRIVAAYDPWGLRVYPVRNALVRPWVQGYLRNPRFLQVWRFVDLDIARQKLGK